MTTKVTDDQVLAQVGAYPISANKISEKIGIHRSNVIPRLSRLQEKGLIKQVKGGWVLASVADGTTLRATTLSEKHLRAAENIFRNLIVCLSDDDVTVFVSSVEKISELLKSGNSEECEINDVLDEELSKLRKIVAIKEYEDDEEEEENTEFWDKYTDPADEILCRLIGSNYYKEQALLEIVGCEKCVLDGLEQKGHVKHEIGYNGTVNWKITQDGRDYINCIHDEDQYIIPDGCCVDYGDNTFCEDKYITLTRIEEEPMSIKEMLRYMTAPEVKFLREFNIVKYEGKQVVVGDGWARCKNFLSKVRWDSK